MIFVLEHHIYHLWYLAILIWNTVDIIHRYGLWELADVKIMLLYKNSIDENSSSSRVNQCMYREQFKSVSSLKKDEEI